LRFISLFSGAGGLDLGLERAGHTVIAQCEIDPVARSVLARHWPDVPRSPDVAYFSTEDFRGRTDLVAGGSPCQDLSVGGSRAGLGGERSGLFWHQCRVADRVVAPWVLWENVPGALSSHGGADFAAVLWGLTGLQPAVPEDGWRSAGLCVGPRRTAVWRVLDARSFGTPQARRRVFVVAGPRDLSRLSLVLDPWELRGDPPPGSLAEGGVPPMLTSALRHRAGTDESTRRRTATPTEAPRRSSPATSSGEEPTSSSTSSAPETSIRSSGSAS